MVALWRYFAEPKGRSGGISRDRRCAIAGAVKCPHRVSYPQKKTALRAVYEAQSALLIRDNR